MTYILLIILKSSLEKEIGRLGVLKFQSGYYAYVGSVKLNFKSRISRHFSKDKKLFWHIDYLLCDVRAEIEKVFISAGAIEHKVAERLYKAGFGVVRKFGSSDCNCAGHLFYVDDPRRFEEEIKGVGFKSWV